MPDTTAPQRSPHSQDEVNLLEYWEKHQIFERSVNERPEAKPYTFYDGPPFATGLPHYGHIVASVMKDVVPRFWTMRGYRVERKWGWDCHGLPIENIVEKKFDFKSKKDIENFGIGKFNETCESVVLDYVEDWKKVIRRLGRWVDMENAYKTMDLPFMESIWWVFKTMWEKGLIYEGYKPMHICPRCETTLSNFEVSQEYADVTDISVTVAVNLTSGHHEGAKVLVWTTTPWTLPGNVLIAVGADMEYALVEMEGEKYILASSCVERVFAGKLYKVMETFSGSTLIHATYDPIFPYFLHHANAFRVVSADFVSDEEGTGMVHIAPAYGEDDMRLGEAEKVAPLFHVKMNGHFIPEVSEPLEAEGYRVGEVPVKAKGAYSEIDIQIIKWLAHHGKLFAKEKLVHSYPHCWRCDTPLLNYATHSWFVRVSSMVDDLVKNNESTHWVPANMKYGRFGKRLEGARDWAISRSRFWGTPLPVWRAEDGEILVIGSKEELEKYVGHAVTNLHKHVIDSLAIEKDGKIYRRIPEVLDCWFESGSMPYAQLHYPFENKEGFDKKFPADFIAEGQDQTSLWFYTLHVIGNVLFGKPAFKNVIVNGIVLAEDGKKMSKRLNNYPDPMMVMEKYGADAVRYYLMSTPVVSATDLRFSESGVEEVGKKFITILRNVVSFYKLYAEHDDYRSPSNKHVLDAWIVARLNETLEEQTRAMESYELDHAARVLQTFVTDLSTWYVRRSRDRMKTEGDDRIEALATLRYVLEMFSKMLAPFMPFLAEMIYREIGQKSEGASVHLETWPVTVKTVGSVVSGDVLEQMGIVRALVSRALEVREQAGIAIKQALGEATLSVPSGDFADAYVQVFCDELNIKKATVQKGDLGVTLNLALTPELLREGMAREITRKINGMRKEAGLSIQDRISAAIFSDSDEVNVMLDEHGESLRVDILATELHFGKHDDWEHVASFRVNEIDVWIGWTIM